jgi:hypothetical protein
MSSAALLERVSTKHTIRHTRGIWKVVFVNVPGIAWIPMSVFLTGHSPGAAIAAVAALHLSDLNPYVMTFGQPLTVDQPCPLINYSHRYYRYVNSKDSVEGRTDGISYDPVPFLPVDGMDSFGHMILLSSDNTGVVFIGLDAQDFWTTRYQRRRARHGEPR